MNHQHSVRVYYEDTDVAGIVYYANYLKYIERARTEWLRSIGIFQTNLRLDHGIVFVVRDLQAEFLAPAKFDDLLSVLTEKRGLSAAKISLRQTVSRAAVKLFVANVTLACVLPSGQPTRIPICLRDSLQTHQNS